jgi:L-fuculose-phosphate aldolase
MKIVGQNGMHFWGEIPFYESEDLIRSKEQGMEVARLMGDKLYVLMRNHGITTAGRSLAEAIILAIDFEKAAKEHLLASLYGKATEVSQENAKKMTDKLFIPEQYQMMWDFYCRKLDRMMSK